MSKVVPLRRKKPAFWFGGWWMRHLASAATAEAMARYAHGEMPGVHWHRCGPREHVAYVVR